jgi:hypothetical protein
MSRMTMQAVVTGVSFMSGKSAKTGKDYEMPRFYVQEKMSSPKADCFGLRSVEYDGETIDLVRACKDWPFPCEAELVIEKQVNSFRDGLVVVSAKAIKAGTK